jgi:hypothetical protein
LLRRKQPAAQYPQSTSICGSTLPVAKRLLHFWDVFIGVAPATQSYPWAEGQSRNTVEKNINSSLQILQRSTM